jgi:DNA-binding CsgD family transcriptional regulator/ligand-binding sensor domain-containing protein
MNTHLRLCFVIIICSIISTDYVISQNEKHANLRSVPLKKHFSSSEYGGGIQSWAFDQDTSGILYVANNMGLLEFDGNTWTKYEVPNCTRVRAVKVDHLNRIFVGGQGQIGYFQMTEYGLDFTSLLSLLPPEQQIIAETWKILYNDDKLYFLTESLLLVYDGNNFRALETPGYVQHIFKSNHQIIAQVYNAGLFLLIGDDFAHMSGSEKIPEIVGTVPNSNGSYFLSNSGEVYRHKDDRFTRMDTPFVMGNITTATQLHTGDYAVGTQNSGLYIFDSDFSFKQHLTKREGLSDRTIKALYEDNFNNLWVALNNGIDYLEISLPFSLINEDIGLEGTGYAACKHNDKIYFGTNNGLYKQKDQGNEDLSQPHLLIPGSEGQVYNFSTIEGDLILNHDQGAFRIDHNGVQKFHDIGSWQFIPTSIPGLVLGGDYQGISYFKKQNNTWVKTGVVPNLNESSRIMEWENDTILWMTHGLKGAYRLQFDSNMNLIEKPEHFGRNNGFPSNTKISIFSLDDNLVFTAEKGIYDFDQTQSKFIINSFFEKSLADGHVNKIVSDGNNSIYFIQENTMGVLFQEKFGIYQKKTGVFKHINKLINDDLPNITILDENNILIGAKEGFILYNPRKRFLINENIKVIFRSVDIKIGDDSIIKYNPYRANDLEIDIKHTLKVSYAAPYFDGFEDLTYAYRLVPLEEKWSEWISRSNMEYPYLPPGSYTFEVKSKNIYDQQSKASAFSFKVLEPWYFTIWAKLFYAVFGLSLVILILILQRRKHLVENTQLANQSKQALKIKDETIDQISKQSNSEIDRLMSEKYKTEIDLKNEQLTTTTMHLLNASDFLQNVKNRILGFIQQGGNRKELNQIVKEIDENLSDHNSWDQFAYHFDQVHSGYLKKLSGNNVNLSPREIKLASFLRMNMSSKEISKLLNISDRGVELARYRLRKKLKLSRDQNLVEYLIDLDD